MMEKQNKVAPKFLPRVLGLSPYGKALLILVKADFLLILSFTHLVHKRARTENYPEVILGSKLL